MGSAPCGSLQRAGRDVLWAQLPSTSNRVLLGRFPRVSHITPWGTFES